MREIGEDGRKPEESFLYNTISVPISLRLIKKTYVGIRDDCITKDTSAGGESLAEADLAEIGEPSGRIPQKMQTHLNVAWRANGKPNAAEPEEFAGL